MNEFTGTYYKCNECGYIWDYNDDACPNCGSDAVTDIPAEEVRMEAERLLKMLELHSN